MPPSPPNPTPKDVSLHISRSNATTVANKTGTWRFFRPRYEEHTAPCSAACPAGEDIGRIQMMAGRRLFSAAGQIALMENPFPAVCGRVCFHPCEAVCNRSGLDEAVAVHHLERLIGDRLLSAGVGPALDRKEDTGRCVAVIGAGPAGLSAAYFLSLLGHTCQVFEAAAEPGGILRWGIPAYRLPAGVLAAEIARIEALGVDIRCGVRLSAEFLETAAHRYDGVFIGCGQDHGVALKIPGEALALDGLSLLRQVRSGRPPALAGRVAVIGGGNTAVDVARTLVRLGAEVVIFYRRRQQDMPAFCHEVDMAVEEGVMIDELAVPVRITANGTHGRGLRQITLQRMTPTGEGPDGRVRVMPADLPLETRPFREVVVAVGADADPEWAPVAGATGRGLELSHCALQFDPVPTATGGDLTNRVKSVADAVASGKQAALAIDACLNHGCEEVAPRLDVCRVGPGPALSLEVYLKGPRCRRSSRIVGEEEINRDYFASLPRLRLDTLPAPQRIASFEPFEEDPAPDGAAMEAARCFNCGICNACDNCRTFCPEVAVSVKGRERRIELDYCKGCGICVAECPRRAMVMEQEAS